MPASDPIPFLNGMAIALYIATYITCGLQLRYDIFHSHHRSASLLSGWLGLLFLCNAFTMALYAVSCIHPEVFFLRHIEKLTDLLLTGLLGCCAHIIYSDRRPPIPVIAAMVLPYFIIALLAFPLNSFATYAWETALLVLICQFSAYLILLRRRMNNQNRTDRHATHALQWLRCAVLIFLVSLAAHSLCIHAGAMDYYCIVGCSSSALICLFISIHINNYSEHDWIRLSRQVAIPFPEDNDDNTVINHQFIQTAFLQLYNTRQPYLDPNLTIEDVARCIHTDTATLNKVLNKYMNTSFDQFNNSCRMRTAKELLANTDLKISAIAQRSGFASSQIMSGIFICITGKTPTDWRKYNSRL